MYLENQDDLIYKNSNNAHAEYAFVHKPGRGQAFYLDYDKVRSLQSAVGTQSWPNERRRQAWFDDIVPNAGRGDQRAQAVLNALGPVWAEIGGVLSNGRSFQARTPRWPTAPRNPTQPMQPTQPTQLTQPMQPTHRRQPTQARHPMHALIPALNTVATLPRTPTLPAVATLPATATLPAVATLPATATLPAVATLPATATLPAVAALPATATLPAVSTLPVTATVCSGSVLSTVGLKRAPSLREASPLRRPFEGSKDVMRARGDGFFCT